MTPPQPVVIDVSKEKKGKKGKGKIASAKERNMSLGETFKGKFTQVP
jgi:hypothetical protein